MWNRKVRWGIFIVALGVRCLALTVLPARDNSMDDTYHWNHVAYRYMEGRGFFTGTEDLDPKRPPIYPLFLAYVYQVWGRGNTPAVQTAQSVLGAGSAVLIGAIAAQILPGTVVPLLASALYSFYPAAIVYCSILQSETLFTFLLLLWVWVWLLAIERKSLRFWALCGFLCGLLTLTRGTTLLIPVFLAGCWVLFRSLRGYWKGWAVFVAVMFLTLAPWTYRNYKVYGVCMPSVAGGPELFWFGTLPIRSQVLCGDSPEFLALKPRFQNNIREDDRLYKREILARLANDPFGYFILTLKKTAYFWYKPVGHESISSSWKRVALLLFHFMVVGLAWLGAWLFRRQWATWQPLYLIAFYFWGFHSVFMPMPRFRVPIESLFVLWAAIALACIFSEDLRAQLKA